MTGAKKNYIDAMVGIALSSQEDFEEVSEALAVLSAAVNLMFKRGMKARIIYATLLAHAAQGARCGSRDVEQFKADAGCIWNGFIAGEMTDRQRGTS